MQVGVADERKIVADSGVEAVIDGQDIFFARRGIGSGEGGPDVVARATGAIADGADEDGFIAATIDENVERAGQSACERG